MKISSKLRSFAEEITYESSRRTDVVTRVVDSNQIYEWNKWCNKNCGNKWVIGERITGRGFVISFNNPEDALAFKLAFAV